MGVQNQMVIENQHFVDNDIRYYCYGTLFTGLLVHVENNLIEYGIYGCGPMGCGAIFVKNGTRPFVARNTIRYTQQWHGIVWLTSGFEGAFNHVHDISTVRDDASNFQTKYSGERKSHMHHNWAYNSELKGVRFDTCGGKGTDGILSVEEQFGTMFFLTRTKVQTSRGTTSYSWGTLHLQTDSA